MNVVSFVCGVVFLALGAFYGLAPGRWLMSRDARRGPGRRLRLVAAALFLFAGVTTVYGSLA